MKENISLACIMLFVSFMAFILTLDDIFPFVMGVVKWILWGIMIICGLSAAGYISSILNIGPWIKNIYTLVFRSGARSMLVNILTLYRILVCSLLLILLFNDHPAFKWVMLSAFITDALDGFLARRLKVTSDLGAKLDSLADDILFVVSVISIAYLNIEIITQNYYLISIMTFVLITKFISLWVLHKKLVSGMHTYLTKASALFQAIFFLHSIFFTPNNILFIVMAIQTILAMAEEIIMIISNKELKPNMKGIFFKPNL